MSEIKLKPCPFCGDMYAPTVMNQNEALWIETDPDIPECDLAIVVCCAVRKGGCGASTGLCDTVEEAVEAWNIRITENPSEINANAPNSGENNLSE